MYITCKNIWTKKFWRVSIIIFRQFFSHFRQISDKNFGHFAKTMPKQIFTYQTQIRLGHMPKG